MSETLDSSEILTGIKILVIDDEPNILDLMKRVLGKKGMTVLTADTVEEGWKLFEKGENLPEIIVTDQKTPSKMTGLDLIREIRQREAANEGSKRTPIILFTAFGTEEMRIEAEEAGADLVLFKPYNLVREFPQRLAELLTKSASITQ